MIRPASRRDQATERKGLRAIVPQSDRAAEDPSSGETGRTGGIDPASDTTPNENQRR